MKNDIYSCLKIDGHCSRPIYQQIIAGMEKFCASGEKDLTLPSERDLCEHLQVSRTILRKALNLCVEKGLLLKRWGKGYSTAGKKVSPKRFLILTSPDSDKRGSGDLQSLPLHPARDRTARGGAGNRTGYRTGSFYL